MRYLITTILLLTMALAGTGCVFSDDGDATPDTVVVDHDTPPASNTTVIDHTAPAPAPDADVDVNVDATK
jgi:hypothetical protein